MAAASTIDLTPIIDRQKVGAFHVRLVVIAFLVVMADGYDISAAAFAGPALIREWHVPPAALGGMFSAGLFSGLFGPLILGWISDHFGRRLVIMAGAAFFGVFTLASVVAENLTTLIVLRFIAGIGISGILPITTSLINEFAPRRMRATLFVLMFSGITFGGGLPGIVAAKFMATYGWQILFWVGGLAPILVAVLVYFALPESIKFLSLRSERHPELVRTLGAMQPGLALDPNSGFTIGGEENREEFSYTAIFKGRLAWITPMFWLSNMINLMIFYFLNQWIPDHSLDQRRSGRARRAGDHRLPVRRHARRSRHHAAPRQVRLRSGADPLPHRHSCRRLHRPAGIVARDDDRAGRSRGLLPPRSAVRQHRHREQHVPDLCPVLGCGLVLWRGPRRRGHRSDRRRRPDRHENADAVSFLYRGDPAGDRLRERAHPGAVLSRRMEPSERDAERAEGSLTSCDALSNACDLARHTTVSRALRSSSSSGVGTTSIAITHAASNEFSEQRFPTDGQIASSNYLVPKAEFVNHFKECLVILETSVKRVHSRNFLRSHKTGS